MAVPKMKKIFEVSRHEYLKHVGKKRFWITLIGAPLGMVLVFAITFLFTYLSFDKNPIGYIDQAGLIKPGEVEEIKPEFLDIVVDKIPYSDEGKARADVENGTLQGYFVIPAGYESSYQVEYFANKRPSSDAEKDIRRFLTSHLLAGEQIPNLSRIQAGSKVSLRSLDGSQQSDGTGWHRIFVPILVGLINFILVMSSGGYLLQSLVEEKQNRTMELMITSVTPNQLMIGKTLGNLSIGFTQIGFWGILAAVALFFLRSRIPLLADLRLTPGYVAVSLGLLVLAFIVTSGLMAMIGATMTTVEEGQSVTGLMVIPMMLPFYFMEVFFTNPNGVIPKILSYIPFSAPLSVSLRMAFTRLPAWEIVLAFAILIASVLLVLWLSGKAYRLGMLEYHKKVSLKDLFRKEAVNG